MSDSTSPNKEDFVEQLRLSIPVAISNAPETFYRAGWEAAMHEKYGPSPASVAANPRQRFSIGLLSGLAAGVGLMLSIQSIDFERNADAIKQIAIPTVSERPEGQVGEDHGEARSNSMGGREELAGGFSRWMFVSTKFVEEPSGSLQQREALMEELTGNWNQNRFSKDAFRFSQSKPTDRYAPDEIKVLRNRVIDNEVWQMLERETRIPRLH